MRLVILSGIALIAMVGISGCTTPGGSRQLTSDVTLLPDLPRFLSAAREAALDPNTWAPAIGAGILTIDNWDRKVSDWATEQHPVFGSRQGALDASDWLRDGLSYWSYITTAFTPYQGDTAAEKSSIKVYELLLNFGTQEGISLATHDLQDYTGRSRPDGSGATSFPSAHASRAFSAAAFAGSNIRMAAIPEPYESILDYTGRGGAWLTAWARVEGGKHYPTDVLASAALANFITVLVHRTFISRKEDTGVSLSVVPTEGGMQWVIGVRF